MDSHVKGVTNMQQHTQYVTEQINSSVNTSDLYSRDIRLEL